MFRESSNNDKSDSISEDVQKTELAEIADVDNVPSDDDMSPDKALSLSGNSAPTTLIDFDSISEDVKETGSAEIADVDNVPSDDDMSPDKALSISSDSAPTKLTDQDVRSIDNSANKVTYFFLVFFFMIHISD